MIDIWGFLNQTLTASGAAGLLLIIKALFKDKLPPKWQFAVWGALGIVMLMPAGWNGRYVLFHWQLIVDVIKMGCGDYSFTRVLFPVPFIKAVPRTIPEWIFMGYVLGVLVCGIRYLMSYVRLRLVLRSGTEPGAETTAHVQQMAEMLKIKSCKIIRVSALPSAFVCGILRPVLVIPEGNLDDKVLLHELLHLKYKDTFWSALICLLRCLHWCNPFLIYCANRAINDMESRCDQHVLEQLKGEERRDYGRILLSMVNDSFAKTPGSTCINNGGKNIRDRIEAIARFKKYPVGMELVSVCAILLLTLSLVVGVQSQVFASDTFAPLSLASARNVYCTTPAGAFDSYGKSILGLLQHNGNYRVMCAPLSMQEELAKEILRNNREGIRPEWATGLPAWPDMKNGYYIYNLEQREENVYEALFVIRLDDILLEEEDEEIMPIAVQNLRVEKEGDRWVAIPLDEFNIMEVAEQDLEWGCEELPALYDNIQTVQTVDNNRLISDNSWYFGNDLYFDMTPKPDAEFGYIVTAELSPQEEGTK